MEVKYKNINALQLLRGRFFVLSVKRDNRDARLLVDSGIDKGTFGSSASKTVLWTENPYNIHVVSQQSVDDMDAVSDDACVVSYNAHVLVFQQRKVHFQS